MTFLEVLTLVKNRVNETDEDEQINIILKNAINYAYLTLRKKVDLRTTEITIPVIGMGAIKLPADFMGVVTMKDNDGYLLNRNDVVIVADTIMTLREEITSIILTYIKAPAMLTTDNTVMELKDIYCLACSIYACYSFYTYKKKVEIANLVANEFNSLLKTDGILIRNGVIIDESKTNN